MFAISPSTSLSSADYMLGYRLARAVRVHRRLVARVDELMRELPRELVLIEAMETAEAVAEFERTADELHGETVAATDEHDQELLSYLQAFIIERREQVSRYEQRVGRYRQLELAWAA